MPLSDQLTNVESDQRAQIRLILEHERLATKKASGEALQALYAENAKLGCLQSGATGKAGIRLLETLISEFVKTAVDQVLSVSMEMEAFAMLQEEMQDLVRVLKQDVKSLTDMVTGGRSDDKSHKSKTDAIDILFRETCIQAGRQLSLHRFTFTKPAKERHHGTPEAIPASPLKGGDASKAKPMTSGRLPADWWDDLWIEIFRQIHLGDLKPKSQADIVRAMQQWLSDNDHETGDSTLKPRARKLFYMLQNMDD